MKILVCSCDKNDDTFDGFHYCMEKHYPTHPEIIYTTESVVNPYYKTICKDYPLEMWTKRIRETLKEIDDDKVLLLVDDIFIRKPVDTDRIEYAIDNLKGNIACFNFEKSFDDNDKETEIIGFKKRKKGSSYELSIMCGLWDKEKLINILSTDSNPWEVEYKQDTKGYDYYINAGDYIIDWGYETWKHVGIMKGKWVRETISYLESEGVKIDYERREIID